MRYRIVDRNGGHEATLEAAPGELLAVRDAFANMFAGAMRGCILRGSITKQEDGSTRIVPRKAGGAFLTSKGAMIFFIATPDHDGHGQ